MGREHKATKNFLTQRGCRTQERSLRLCKIRFTGRSWGSYQRIRGLNKTLPPSAVSAKRKGVEPGMAALLIVLNPDSKGGY